MHTSNQAPYVSIVIPARNESARLPASIREIRRIFPSEPWEFLLVIEPGEDDTEAAARLAVDGDPRFVIIANPSAYGKGFAVRTGMLQAQGEWFFFMDADLSVPLRFVGAFLQAGEKFDVLVGSRRHPQSVIKIRQPWLRERAGRLFNIVLRLSGATRLADTQCGFKAFRREAARAIFPLIEQDGFGFDVEAIVLAEALGFKILELPVDWADAAGSKVRPLRDVITSLMEAVLAARRIRNKYRSHANTRS